MRATRPSGATLSLGEHKTGDHRMSAYVTTMNVRLREGGSRIIIPQTASKKIVRARTQWFPHPHPCPAGERRRCWRHATRWPRRQSRSTAPSGRGTGCTQRSTPSACAQRELAAQHQAFAGPKTSAGRHRRPWQGTCTHAVTARRPGSAAAAAPRQRDSSATLAVACWGCS